MNDSTTPNRPFSRDTLVSVVLPVLNEAAALPMLLELVSKALAECDTDYEILFVNDGSSDASPQILDELAEKNRRVRVIHLSRNFGHQAAIQAGLVYARGDAVVLMDSDLQDSPQAIVQFVEEWRAGYDVVYAVRSQRKENRLKRFLFATFHRMMATIGTVRVPADAGVFGLIDRRVVDQVVSMGETDRYFPGLRSWVGFKQKGVTVPRGARYDGRPRVSMYGLCRLAKTAIFSFSTFPLAVFYMIGMMATAVFMGLGAYAVFCRLFTDLAIPGWTSHILTGSFFGALNALGICILGEYVIRIYDQVRQRPLYLVDRTVNMPGEPQSDAREDREADRPYTELLEHAVHLLDACSLPDASARQSEEVEDLGEPLIFPLEDD